MSRRLKQAHIILVVAFAAAQLVRPERANPVSDVNRNIRTQGGRRAGWSPFWIARATIVIRTPPCGRGTPNRACVLADGKGVKEGRKAVNFSEWTAYPPERQRSLLMASCQDASAGKMPGPYTLLHPEMRLSPQDIETICTAARQAEGNAAEGR